MPLCEACHAPCMICSCSKPPSSWTYSASSRMLTLRTSGSTLPRTSLALSSAGSRSGCRCLGKGAATLEVDRAVEGMRSDQARSVLAWKMCLQKKPTLCGQNKVSGGDANMLWLDQQAVVALVNLGVCPLHRIESRFSAQSLRRIHDHQRRSGA